jgi:hypothetical protein
LTNTYVNPSDMMQAYGQTKSSGAGSYYSATKFTDSDPYDDIRLKHSSIVYGKSIDRVYNNGTEKTLFIPQREKVFSRSKYMPSECFKRGCR